jgi:hypothetical protein
LSLVEKDGLLTRYTGKTVSWVRIPPSPPFVFRRDARADDWGCLENSCTRKSTVGSNPTPAANQKTGLTGFLFSGYNNSNGFFSTGFL